MMDGSFVDEVQKQQQNLIDTARAEAIKQDPTLSYVQRQIAKGLLGAKQEWEAAYNAGDAAGMANAALQGRSLREQGNAIGWDGAGYGEGVSLHEAAMNLANNDTRAVNNLLYNMKDSNDIYQQKVVEYLDKGYSIDSARRMAGQRSSENTASNLNQIRDAFRMYGMDERGAITPQGADILASLALNGQGELANFYANMLPKPVQNWNFDNSLITAANAQDNALMRMAQQYKYGQMKAAADQQRARENAQWKADFNDARAQKAIAERFYYARDVMGYSDEESKHFALTGKLPSAKSGGTRANGSSEGAEEPKLSSSEKKILNAIKNNEARIESLLRAGNDEEKIEEAAQAIDEYIELYKKWTNDGVDYDTMRGVEKRIKEYTDQLNLNKQGGINQATGGPSGGITGAEYMDEETFNSLPEEAQQYIKERYEALDEQSLSNLPETRQEMIRKIRGY
jgi:Ca2+-binding EF-hand superfamily protein